MLADRLPSPSNSSMPTLRLPNLRLSNLREPEAPKPFGLRLANLRESEALAPPLADESVQPRAASAWAEAAKPVEALPGLFFGNALLAADLQALQAARVDVVVNLVAGIAENKFPTHFHYESYFLQDVANVNVDQSIECILDRIHAHVAAGRRVFVHCRKGISRAPSVVLGYLIKFAGRSFDEAFLALRAKNPAIDPNLGFIIQLHGLERCALATQTDALTNL